MIRVQHDAAHNALIIEFVGIIRAADAEAFFEEVQHELPKLDKGFTIITDLSAVEHMDADVKGPITKGMDLFNQRGVARVLRVIPDPGKDIGFNILSIFHYDKHVRFLTFATREEAMERLKSK